MVIVELGPWASGSCALATNEATWTRGQDRQRISSSCRCEKQVISESRSANTAIGTTIIGGNPVDVRIGPEVVHTLFLYF